MHLLNQGYLAMVLNVPTVIVWKAIMKLCSLKEKRQPYIVHRRAAADH